MKKTYSRPEIWVEVLRAEIPLLGSNENTFRITGNSGFIYGGGGSGPARADESQVWDDEGENLWDQL